MTPLPRRDRLGARRILFDPVSGEHAAALRTLLARVPAARAGGLDALGVDAAWGNADAPDRTCLRAVRAVPPSRPAAPEPPCDAAPSALDALAAAIVLATQRALASARRPVVALGGGIDAPLALLAARRARIEIRDAIHLSLPGTSYDESARARETAAALGLSLHELRVTTDELARELPRAVALAETPLYNLHPVSRAIVARVAAARGHDALVTGDGADQAARGATETADYVPVVAAITQASGLHLASPFVDDEVVDRLACARDPAKDGLRELASRWGLPDALAARPKEPCSAPPLPRSAFPAAAAVERLARSLDRPLAWSDDDRANVGVASLAAFVSAFEISLRARGAA